MKEVSDSAEVKTCKLRACAYVAGLLVVLIPSQVNITHAQQPVYGRHSYREYVNTRYGYSICYPEDIFVPQGEEVARDGQLFLAPDGAELRVYANYNIFNNTIRDEFKDAVSKEGKKGVVKNKVLRNGWFVVSGKNDGNIFYRKTILEKGQFITFRAVYPETAKAAYAGVVEAVNKCLKSLEPN